MPPTTTANPIEVFANATVANYNSFFDLAFSNLDTSNVVANQAALIESMGGNATISDQYFDALASLISILSSTPDPVQEARIAQGVADLFKLTEDLIASFPGMENFETNANLMMDPENAAFYALYNQLKTDSDSLIADPASAFAYFTNNAVQAKLAEIVALAKEVSQKAEQCEYSASLAIEISHDLCHYFTIMSIV